MAKITVKRSSVEGKIPLTTDLDLGEFAVNTYDGKLFLKRDNGIGQYIVEVGGNQGFYVKNQTGSAINKGTLVGFVGTLGSSGKLLVAPYLANGSIPSEYFIGVVSETIPNGGDGFVIDHGTIYNLNTVSWPAGTVLYASSTAAGALTSTMPQAPNNKITVAAVVNSHANAGVLEVRVTLGSKLQNDELVQLGTLAGGDTLAYNATAGRFENSPLKTVNGTSLLGSGDISIEAPANAVPNRQVYTATSGQTSFAITYTPGYLDAYLNGVKQVVGVDLTATSGTGVVFATGLVSGDVVELVGYNIASMADPSKLPLSGGTMSGDIVFAPTQTFPSAGLSYVYKTANYTANNNEGVLTNTAGGSFTVTLPVAPAVGAQVVVADSSGSWSTNNLTVARNGATIGGLAENLICDIANAQIHFIYSGTTWNTFAQIGGNGGTAVTLNGAQVVTNKDLTSNTNTFPTTLATTGKAIAMAIVFGG